MIRHPDQFTEERGVLGVLDVPAGVRVSLPRDVARARLVAIASCTLLAASLAVLAVNPSSRTIAAVPWLAGTSFAIALAYFASAFLLDSRLVVSRTPALSILAATLLYAGILLIAQTVSPGPIGDWFWFYSQAGIAIGIASFGAADWYWAKRQREVAQRDGFYSDNRQRFMRLTLRGAGRRIGISAAAGLTSAVAAIYASADASCCYQPRSGASTYLAGAALAASFLLAALIALRTSRGSTRLLASLLAFSALLGGALWAPALLNTESALPNATTVPGTVHFTLLAMVAIAATAILVFAKGHMTIFRWSIVVSAVATACTCLAAALWSDGSMSRLSTTYIYPLIAALAPLAVLLYDAKVGVIAADDQNTALRDLALIDKTSGLANFRSLLLHLGRQIALADAAGVRFPIVIVDLAGVKESNRAAGRHVGADLIAFAGRVLAGVFRPAGLPARIRGGDAFAVLLPAGPKPDEGDLQRTIEAAIAAESWRIAPLSLRFYLNVYEYDPAVPMSANQFIRTCKRDATSLKGSAASEDTAQPQPADRPA